MSVQHQQLNYIQKEVSEQNQIQCMELLKKHVGLNGELYTTLKTWHLSRQIFCIIILMTDELKKRRKLSYLMNIWDDVDLPYVFNDNDISRKTIDFFKNVSELVYPAKSYFVAIVYAKCLEKYFSIDFYESLNDEELLPDDKFFVKYEKSKDIYDRILSEIKIDSLLSLPSVQKTVEYFKKEFLINGTDNKDNRSM